MTGLSDLFWDGNRQVVGRRLVVCTVLMVVVLGGCVGSPGPNPADPETGTETPSEISGAAVPGVTNGSLTNATALALANEAELSARGGAVEVNRSTETRQSSFRFVVGVDRATYTLAGTYSEVGDRATSISVWSNETTRILRMTSDGEHTYRASDRRHARLAALEGVRERLAAGEFTVANETTDEGTVVLTADGPDRSGAGDGPLTETSEYSGRLVVSKSGLIHNLTVSATVDGEDRTYRFGVRRTGIDRVDKPEWTDDVPASAWLDPTLSVNVENSSYLVVRNEGDDPVPRNATISITTNGTTETGPFETALETGDTRFAYIDATGGQLTVTSDRPSAGAVESVTSPVSVTITTEDNVTLHSGGMAWESESASEGAGSSSGTTDTGGSK